MSLPENPIMLMSLINTLLRDEYDSLDSLCSDRDIDKAELINKLKEAGFEYLPQINQFR